MNDFKIINYGSMNKDMVYRLSDIVKPGETLSALSLDFFPGGKGLNQSLAMARAGAKVCHAGCVGEDGALLLECLNREGVNTERVESLKMPGGHAIIQLSKTGENSIIVFGGANKNVSDDYLARLEADFAMNDVLVLQNECNGLEKVILSAAEKGVRIVLNPSPWEEQLTELPLDRVDMFIVNETEARGLSAKEYGQDCLEMLAKKYRDAEVICTLGNKGATAVKAGKRYFQDAFPTKVVDTTAAGDTFLGYYVVERFSGADIPSALRLACKAASVAVSRSGAAPSIPKREELD